VRRCRLHATLGPPRYLLLVVAHLAFFFWLAGCVHTSGLGSIADTGHCRCSFIRPGALALESLGDLSDCALLYTLRPNFYADDYTTFKSLFYDPRR
jgi:hypothetical protein